MERLRAHGVELADVGDRLCLEIDLLRFYPNHIEGVIEQVLKGGNVAAKVDRANAQGWGYFALPVESLLRAREGAIRSDAISPEHVVALLGGNRSGLRRTYTMVCSMVSADMTHEEVRKLFVELWSLGPSEEALRAAIAVCKERDARTVYYLYGVLSKETQRAETRRSELLRDRSEQEVWRPGPGFVGLTAEEIEEARRRWVEREVDIDLMREL